MDPAASPPATDPLTRMSADLARYFTGRRPFDIKLELYDEDTKQARRVVLPLPAVFTPLSAYGRDDVDRCFREVRTKAQLGAAPADATPQLDDIDAVVLELDKKAHRRCTAADLHRNVGPPPPDGGARVVLLEGQAGVGKTCFARHLCQKQHFPGYLAVYIDLATLYNSFVLNSQFPLQHPVDEAMKQLFTPHFLLQEALKHDSDHTLRWDAGTWAAAAGAHIVWVLDGLDEVQETTHPCMQWVLRHFISPSGRRHEAPAACVAGRDADIVVVCSRGQRLRGACDLDGADCWLVRPWTFDEVPPYVSQFVKAVAPDVSDGALDLLHRTTQLALGLARSPQLRRDAGLPVLLQMITTEALGRAMTDPAGLPATQGTPLDRPMLYLNALRRTWLHNHQKEGKAEMSARDKQRFLDAVRTAGRYAFTALSAIDVRITFELRDAADRVPAQRDALQRLGLKSLDPMTSQFRFQHRTFLEYFAARHMKEHLRDTVGEMPLAATRRIVWLFLADMLRSDADVAALDAFTDSVAGRFREKAERYAAGRPYEALLEAPPPEDAVPVSLIVELATILSPDAFFMRLERGWFRRVLLRCCSCSCCESPVYFWWMVEHCGTHHAAHLLERIHKSLTEQHANCAGTVSRLLERALVRAVQAGVSGARTRTGTCKRRAASSCCSKVRWASRCDWRRPWRWTRRRRACRRCGRPRPHRRRCTAPWTTRCLAAGCRPPRRSCSTAAPHVGCTRHCPRGSGTTNRRCCNAW